MNIADINDAPADGPTRFGLHSVEGFGKTTLAAYFPAPVFIASENGFPRDLPFRPKRFPHPETWNDVRTAIASLTTDKHDRETLVVDTVDHVEPLLHRFLCQRDSGRKTEMNRSGNELISIEDYGFGKGYIAAEEEFRSLIADLDTLQRKRGMHIVLLMHSSPKKVNNLFGADFDKYEPKMHARISAIVKEWVENLFFGYFEVAAGKLGDEKKAKGVSTGRRLLGTRANALFDAKNRMNLPAEIELGQPEVLIPYLLGEHLADQAAPTSRSKSVAPRVTKQEPAPKTEKAPAKTNGKSNGKAEAKPEAKPEPEKTVAPEPDTRSNDGPSEMTETEKKLAEARERVISAGIVSANGRPYEEAIDNWISKANGKEDKLVAILTRVENDISQYNQSQA